MSKAQMTQSLTPLNFEDTPVEDLEQLRPRLTQLTHSLRKLEESLRNLNYNQYSVLELTAIQNQFNVILHQLSSLSKTLQNYKERLSVTTVFPNREFNTMSGLLFNLLRKKLTPEVEEWLKNATNIATSSDANLTSNLNLNSSISPPSTSNTNTTINTAAATTHSLYKLQSDTLETLLFKDDEFTDNLIDYAHESLEDYMFGGYLTKNELESGLKITDVLKNIKMEDLEPSQNSNSNSTSNSFSENEILGFIYQGFDSNVSIK